MRKVPPLYLGVHGVPNSQQKWCISGWKAYVISESPTDVLYYLESITKIVSCKIWPVQRDELVEFDC